MTDAVTPPQIVFIVDDDASVRTFLAQLMETNKLPSMTFETARAFLENYRPGTPGCLVLDIHLPGMSGLDLQKELVSRGIEIPIIILTGAGDIGMAREAFKSGVVDFVTKPFKNAELLECIDRALARDIDLRRRNTVANDARTRFARLSAREREVVDLLVEGKSTKEIAFQLSLSPKTVDVHRANGMRKLDVNSIAEMVHLSVALGSEPRHARDS
ncbi:MAG: response regulator transcription factor [Planctomycetes bacterium]|nr:response regulator transcription factor [Planctomycetota bacterium]